MVLRSWFDISCVVLALVDLTVTLAAQAAGGEADTGPMTSLKMLKLARLGRIVRLLKFKIFQVWRVRLYLKKTSKDHEEVIIVLDRFKRLYAINFVYINIYICNMYVCICMCVCMYVCMYVCMDRWMDGYHVMHVLLFPFQPPPSGWTQPIRGGGGGHAAGGRDHIYT